MKNLSNVALLALVIAMGFEACTKNNNPAPKPTATASKQINSSTTLFRRDTLTPLVKKDTLTPIKIILPLVKRDTLTPITIISPLIKRDTLTPNH